MRLSLRWIPAAALLFAACVPSLNPFYTADDVIFDPGLVGEWVSEGDDESFTFERGKDDAYSAVHRESGGGEGPFTVYLFSLGETRFIDFLPEDADSSGNEFYDFHWLAAHTVMRAKRDGDSLQLALIDLEWFEDFLEEDPEALQHVELEDGRVILTGPTAQVREFLAKHHAEAFDDPGVWKRRTASTNDESAG